MSSAKISTTFGRAASAASILVAAPVTNMASSAMNPEKSRRLHILAALIGLHQGLINLSEFSGTRSIGLDEILDRTIQRFQQMTPGFLVQEIKLKVVFCRHFYRAVGTQPWILAIRWHGAASFHSWGKQFNFSRQL